MRPVTLEFKQALYKYRDPIKFVYFPARGAAAALLTMQDGRSIVDLPRT